MANGVRLSPFRGVRSWREVRERVGTRSVDRQGLGLYQPPRSRRDTQRLTLPRMTWSTRRMPRLSAASQSLRVKRRSSALGAGSELG